MSRAAAARLARGAALPALYAGWGEALVARFATAPTRESSSALRIGVVFGPRAATALTGTNIELRIANDSGTTVEASMAFKSIDGLAAFWIDQLNASLARAGIRFPVHVAATATLAREEQVPASPAPPALLRDLGEGVVEEDGVALPLERWAARQRLASLIVVADWILDRSRLSRGAIAGATLMTARRIGSELCFWPASIVDATCARLAFGLAHEFGHQLGVMHENVVDAPFTGARGFAVQGGPISVMALGRAGGLDRALQWSRPEPSAGGAWPWGDADHDDAAWMKTALPLLARQCFR